MDLELHSVAGTVANSSNKSQEAPVIFISFGATPNKFDKADYFKKLQASLIGNGFSKSTTVMEYSMTEKLKAWWNNSPSTTISFSTFQPGFPTDAGGFSTLGNPNSIIIYSGLSDSSIAAIYPTDAYVQATLHEVGHAFFGFDHDDNGHPTGISATGQTVMDYQFAYDSGQGFNIAEKEFASRSIWGNH